MWKSPSESFPSSNSLMPYCLEQWEQNSILDWCSSNSNYTNNDNIQIIGSHWLLWRYISSLLLWLDAVSILEIAHGHTFWIMQWFSIINGDIILTDDVQCSLVVVSCLWSFIDIWENDKKKHTSIHSSNLR